MPRLKLIDYVNKLTRSKIFDLGALPQLSHTPLDFSAQRLSLIVLEVFVKVPKETKDIGHEGMAQDASWVPLEIGARSGLHLAQKF